jgi:hypothetical protein
MKSKMKFSKTALWCLLIIFCLFGCRKIGEESPATAYNSNENQSLLSNTTASSLSTKPDIIVNTTSDVADFNDPQQISDLPGPDGHVSLREAIIAANNTVGSQVIGFKIPKNDPGFDKIVFTIKPLSELPGLSVDGITINGDTQSNFTGNTNKVGPEIVIDGSLLDPDVESMGLYISSASNWINGLVIQNFWDGINITGEDAVGNVVTGCFIGTDASGMLARPNKLYGIANRSGASGTRIGGPLKKDRNLISGTPHVGLFLAHGTHDDIIQGNFIGTDITGKRAIGNDYGILCINHLYNILIIGNLVSGNNHDGINIQNDIIDMKIQSNLIGTDVDRNSVLGNGDKGINIGPGELLPPSNKILIGGNLFSEANLISDNVSGGISIGGFAERIVVEGNTICRNHGIGVVIVESALGNTVSKNSIFSNEGLGIDLEGAGVTQNDQGDGDIGPNNLMNIPVLTSARKNKGKLIVEGIIDTPNPQTVTLEFFANPVPIPGGNPSGYGEGAIYLGSYQPNSQGIINATLPTVVPGTLITATATDANGNTSEFSAYIEAM